MVTDHLPAFELYIAKHRVYTSTVADTISRPIMRRIQIKDVSHHQRIAEETLASALIDLNRDTRYNWRIADTREY